MFGTLGGVFWSHARWPGIMGLVGTLIAVAAVLAWWLMRREHAAPERV